MSDGVAPAFDSPGSDWGGVGSKEFAMLWAILAVILILWLLGFIGGVGGSLIHLLLVVAAIVLIIQLITGRSSSAV
jgi:hypothetical protein